MSFLFIFEDSRDNFRSLSDRNCLESFWQWRSVKPVCAWWGWATLTFLHGFPSHMGLGFQIQGSHRWLKQPTTISQLWNPWSQDQGSFLALGHACHSSYQCEPWGTSGNFQTTNQGRPQRTWRPLLSLTLCSHNTTPHSINSIRAWFCSFRRRCNVPWLNGVLHRRKRGE